MNMDSTIVNRSSVGKDIKMYRVEVPKSIHLFTESLHRIGFWHRNDVETMSERVLKFFYSIYFLLFPISIAAVESVDTDVKIFSIFVIMSCVVFETKLLLLIWNKTEILEVFDKICDYDIDHRETYTKVNIKLTNFKKFTAIFVTVSYFTILCIVFVAPFVGTERKQIFHYGFQLDWRKSEFAYWAAFIFTATESAIIASLVLFSVFIWYLMVNCSWRYDVLGSKIKRMDEGSVVVEAGNERDISMIERDNFYNRNLGEAVESYNSLNEMIDHLISFLTNVFTVQLTTSALCICMAIYNIIITRGDNLVELLIYFGLLSYCLFDIFMIMHFGNEIKLASGRLSYNLYESNWIDRSHTVKKNVILFGELLMQPHQLMILKIYPLTLETFSRILNSAYSMVNILKNLK